MMKSLRIIVKGIVQRVGYRNRVYRIAKTLKVKGYVKNLDDPDESVEILAQQDEGILKKFLDLININDGIISVEEIAQKEVEEKEYPKFEIIRGPYEEENAERLDVAALHLGNLTNEVRKGNKELKIGQDQMLEKQDETRIELSSKLDSFHENTSTKFGVMEQKYGAVSENLEKISKDLHELVNILREFKPNK